MKDFRSTNVTPALQSIFPNAAAALFAFDSARNQLEAGILSRIRSQIPLPYPINVSPDDVARANAAAAESRMNKRSRVSSGHEPPIEDSDLSGSDNNDETPSAKTIQNRKKRNKQKEKTKALRAQVLAAGLDAAPAAVGSASRARSGSGYCVNHYGHQLVASPSFPNGMPPAANCRPCAPRDGIPCTRTHLTATLQPGQLDKGIADDLITGVSTFTNPAYKDNFIRIIQFLKAV